MSEKRTSCYFHYSVDVERVNHRLCGYLKHAIAEIDSIGYQAGFKNPNLGPDISYNLYIVIMLCEYILYY